MTISINDKSRKKSPLEKVARRKQAQQDRSQAKVDRILDVTLELLSNNPAQNIGTKAIAKAAGVSVGTLYRFFPNKEAVFYELFRVWLAENVQALDRLIAELGPDTSLEEFTDAFIREMTRPELNKSGHWRLRLAMGSSKKLAELETQHRLDVVQRIVVLQNKFSKLPDPDCAEDVMLLQNEITIACLFSIARAQSEENTERVTALCRKLLLLTFDYETWSKG